MVFDSATIAILDLFGDVIVVKIMENGQVDRLEEDLLSGLLKGLNKDLT